MVMQLRRRVITTQTLGLQALLEQAVDAVLGLPLKEWDAEQEAEVDRLLADAAKLAVQGVMKHKSLHCYVGPVLLSCSRLTRPAPHNHDAEFIARTSAMLCIVVHTWPKLVQFVFADVGA
jgi:hypothetical protein